MTDAVTRAEQLIALACSTTHEEEARTAALSAARLIQKEGLRLVSQGAPAQRPQRVRVRRGYGGQNVEAEEAFYRETEAFYRAAKARQYGGQESEPPPSGASPNGFWKDCRGKLDCSSCGDAIEDGERYYEEQTSWAGRRIWCNKHRPV